MTDFTSIELSWAELCPWYTYQKSLLYQKTGSVNRHKNGPCPIRYQKLIQEKFSTKWHVRRVRNRYRFSGTSFWYWFLVGVILLSLLCVYLCAVIWANKDACLLTCVIGIKLVARWLLRWHRWVGWLCVCRVVSWKWKVGFAVSRTLSSLSALPLELSRQVMCAVWLRVIYMLRSIQPSICCM